MNLGVDHPKAAVVAIDLHRGHLDMAVATMPTTPDVAARVIAANKRLFDVISRRRGDPRQSVLADPSRGSDRDAQERDAAQYHRWSRLHGDAAVA
jgi:hypothetical protein